MEYENEPKNIIKPIMFIILFIVLVLIGIYFLINQRNLSPKKTDPVEKPSNVEKEEDNSAFVEDLKALFFEAQQTWINDSVEESVERTYCNISECLNPLKKAPKDYTYSITINSKGYVTDFFANNGIKEFSYTGENLTTDIINGNNISVNKDFISKVKTILKDSEQKWISDSKLETSTRVYCNVDNCKTNGSDYSGYKYYISINKEGKVTKLYVTNGTYQYSYKGEGLELEDITNAVLISEINSDEVITITPNM